MISAAPAAATVVWSDPAVDIDRDGDPVLRVDRESLGFRRGVRRDRSRAVDHRRVAGRPVVGPPARGARDAHRAARRRPREAARRDRNRGRARSRSRPSGSRRPETLVVTDDGPAVPPAADGHGARRRPPPRARASSTRRSRTPSTRGASGRFAADLWLTNTDAVNPITLSLLFNPVGAPARRLGPPPLRPPARGRRDAPLPQRRRDAARLRGRVHGRGALLGAHRDARRRSSRTRPLPATVAARASRRALDGATPATGLYGFEMRPTSPGEGVEAERPDPRGVGPRARREPPLEPPPPRDVRLRHDGPRSRCSTRRRAGLTKNGQVVRASSRPFRRTGRSSSTTTTSSSTRRRSSGAYAYATDPVEVERDATRRAPRRAPSSGWRRSSTTGRRTRRSTWASRRTALNPVATCPARASPASRARARVPAVRRRLRLRSRFPTVHSAGAPLASGDETLLADACHAHEHVTTDASQRPTLEVPRRRRQHGHAALTSASRRAAVVSFEDVLEEVFGILSRPEHVRRRS